MKKYLFMILCFSFSFFSCSKIEIKSINRIWQGSILNPDTYENSNYTDFMFNENGSYSLDCSLDSRDYYHDYIGPENLLYGGFVYTEKGEFKTFTKDGFSYIKLNPKGKKALKKELGLFINPRRLYLFDGDSLFFASEEKVNWNLLGYNLEIQSVSSSSCKKNEREIFDGNNFSKNGKPSLTPWISDDKDNDEWFEFTVSSNLKEWGVESFLILNGYVSFDNPDLYGKYNRIKDYEITSELLETPVSGTFQDLVELQEIKLPVPVFDEEMTFKINIKSVYEGEEFDNTCISFIRALPPVPTETPEKF